MAMNEGAPIIIKKKKGHGHGHHGGAWKVAYADFVTAMMAFFLVMWIMGMSQDQRNEIQGYFNDPFGYTSSPPKGRPNFGFSGVRHRASADSLSEQALAAKERDRRQLSQVKESFETFLAKEMGKGGATDIFLKNVVVKITQEGLEIEFIEGKGIAYFQVGSSNVTDAARKVIGEIAPVLGKSGRVMFVDGHTDSRVYVGSAYDNFDLSSDRAQAVKRALVVSGVPKQMILGVRGFADTRLRMPSNPLADENRRVSIVLPFLNTTSPKMGELKTGNDARKEVEELRKGLGIPRVPRLGAGH